MATMRRQHVNYSLGWLHASSLLCITLTAACGEPNPRSVRGAIEAAMADIEAGDGEALYLHIDERGRHALGGIIVARHKAKEVIESDYPPERRATALAALGDGAIAKSAASLFAMRCPRDCMKDIERQLGAPVAEKTVGQETIVRTTRGTTVKLHLGGDTWYGIVWHTEDLMSERDRAARELVQIEENAALYRKQRSLQRASEPNSASR